MKNYLIIGGIIAALFVSIYLYNRRKKTTDKPGQLEAGGIFAPKVLDQSDYENLEKIFKSGNPFSGEKAKAIEGQPIDENEPLKSDGTAKSLVTAQQFNNIVLTAIRNHIGNRSEWVQAEENRRFEEWRGAARAGYNNSLAQAFAYAVRTHYAATNYYPETVTPGTPGTPGTTPKETELSSLVPDSLKSLSWTKTNNPDYIKATRPDNIVIYFKISTSTLLTDKQAKSAGVI